MTKSFLGGLRGLAQGNRRHTILDSGIRNRHHCLVAGVEKADGELHAADINTPFEEGDILWIVGEKEDVERVMES